MFVHRLKNDSCTKPDLLIGPRRLLLSQLSDLKPTASGTSTWLALKPGSNAFVKTRKSRPEEKASFYPVPSSLPFTAASSPATARATAAGRGTSSEELRAPVRSLGRPCCPILLLRAHRR